MNHEFTIHVGTHATQQFTFPTQVTQPTTTNTGIPAEIFPAENGTVKTVGKTPQPFSFPPVFPFCFPIFLFFHENGLRSV